MNAFQYVDIKFQQASVAIGKMNSTTYDLKTGGEAQALTMILKWLRTFYKWVAVPKIIFGFILVKLHIKPEPISPLIPKAVPDQPKDQKELKLVNAPGSQANDQEPQATS